MARVVDFRDLNVYSRAFESAAEIFEVSKRFPAEERYSLTDQMRRSSRSVCANIAEPWRKRRYPAACVSKLSDADTEVGETTVWLDFALRCEYLELERHRQLAASYHQICAQLVKMMAVPEQWCGATHHRPTPD